jgi:hypothetical protein
MVFILFLVSSVIRVIAFWFITGKINVGDYDEYTCKEIRWEKRNFYSILDMRIYHYDDSYGSSLWGWPATWAVSYGWFQHSRNWSLWFEYQRGSYVGKVAVVSLRIRYILSLIQIVSSMKNYSIHFCFLNVVSMDECCSSLLGNSERANELAG